MLPHPLATTELAFSSHHSYLPSLKYSTPHPHPQNHVVDPDIPNLQRPRPQNPRPLILRHVRRRTPLIIIDPLLPQSHHPTLLRSVPRIHLHYIPPRRLCTIRQRNLRIWVIGCEASSGCLSRRGSCVFWVVGVLGVLGLLVVEFGLFGLVFADVVSVGVWVVPKVGMWG